MSRPRRPYGPNPPGRLFATMIKVLAAELSDQQRLSRGKRYHADDAVIDITVGHGAVTAEVQGGRAEPYVVTLEAAGGEGVPSRRELWVNCTCPDDTGTGADACKHAVAALFALSDEVAIEPELLDRWRAGRRTARPSDTAVTRLPDRDPDVPDADVADPDVPDADDRPMADVIELRPSSPARPERPGEPEPDPEVGELAALLVAPSGVTLGELPVPEPIEHDGLRDRILAEVLDDALDHLAIRWE